MKIRLFLFVALTSLACREDKGQPSSLLGLAENAEFITGKPEYLQTPFVTAGDRLYMVGHQDGSFPDLGWHVPGEMGGIWDHPIKLMDGFALSMAFEDSEERWCLNNASEFINYPFANKHTFISPDGGLNATRFQFVPDGLEGMLVEYVLTNTGPKDRELEVAFTGMVDLTPVWLSERLNIEDSRDSVVWDETLKVARGWDTANPWHVVFGGSQEVQKFEKSPAACPAERKGLGVDGSLVSSLRLEAGETAVLHYYIAGSYRSQKQADSTYLQLKNTAPLLLEQKLKRYEGIRRLSDISIPDKEVEEMYRWVKYNTDWLIRDVDTIGRGLSAGLPDYPWWFGADNCYALQGWLATGQHKEVLSTIKLLMELSAALNGNGRIIHETSTNGVNYNPGNLNETPQFIYLLWKAYQWTGDRSLLENYFPDVKKGLEYLQRQDKDGNGYPDGPGMMEIHGLHSEMIDVVVYTQQAFEAASKMAAEMGDAALAESYQRKAANLKDKINTEWWAAEFSSFADFRSTREAALGLIDAAMVRADTIDKPWAIEELKSTREKILKDGRTGTQSFVVHHNWVVNTPMEMGVADTAKAEKALETARRYCNRFGMYVTGIDRAEDSDSASKWKAFSYVGAVMTLPTGVQAVAEARYGHAGRALEYLQRLGNSFSYALPGSLYEVSPDYGMVVQAWNIYAVAVPIVEHFFGIQPNAPKKEIVIQPAMPEHWKDAAISNVTVGSNSLSYSKSTEGTKVTYSISQKADWKIFLRLPFKPGTEIVVNGQKQDLKGGGRTIKLALSGVENKIEVR